MPTDQESARTAGPLAEGQDTADQIHSEPPEPTELRHGTSSDSIPSDWKHGSERLATYAEVDETDEGVDIFRGRGEKNGSKTGQSPGLQDQSGKLDNANTNDHPGHSETSSDRKSRDGVPDNNVSDVGDKNGTELSLDTSDHQVNTKLNQDISDKNFKAAQSVVNNLDDESEKHPQNESSSDKDTKQVAQEGVATGHGGQIIKKAEQKAEAKPSEDGSAAKTPRGTSGKPTTAKQGKKDHSRETDQKTGKRTPPAASKSPRIGDSRVHRPPTERNPKKDDKTDKNEEKQKSTQSRTSGKPGTPVSRPVDSRETKPAESKPPAEKPAESTNPSDAGSATDTTNNPTTATSPGTKPDTEETKPVNGMVPDGGKEKGKEPEAKENNKKEDEKEQPQHKKAHALLSRAVMRRMTTMEKAPTGQTSPSPRGNNAAADLNSSAGAKSLGGGGGGGKSPSPVPFQGRSAHKTLSMQSLAVPATGIGPTPVETDDKEESLGSRRDSVRQSVDSNSRKSVDYRLQTSHTVVTPAAAEEKPNSLWHDDSVIRAAIPALSVPLAVFCLIINIVLPGSGTVVSGMSVLCCSKARLSSKGDTVTTTVCINLCVGAAQLGTVTFLMVGWFWSLAWGIKMVILAVEHRAERRQQREKELQTLALRAFGSPGNLCRSTLPPV